MKRLIYLFICVCLFVACADEPDPTPTPDIVTETPTVTATPLPEPTSTPTPTATPIPPSVEAGFQTLDETGTIQIDELIIPVEGWVVVYDATGERPLASARVSPNRATPLQLTIDPFAATESLLVRLYVDEGQADVFDDDPPLLLDGEPVQIVVDVDFAFSPPEIRVSDQTITETESLARVAYVMSPADGWVGIHDYTDQTVGTLLGHLFVETGETNNLAIPVNWRNGSREWVAVLYADNGRSRRFDTDTDTQIEASGDPVIAPFTVDLPYDLFILDQPVVNNQVVIEQIIVNEPSWVVLHPDVEGELGLIAGFTHLDAGVNSSVVITLLAGAQVTSPMYVKLHQDVAEPDVFDFPGDDIPVTVNGRQLTPVAFSTTPGNYLITRDQLVTDEQATIPLAVLAQPAWVVVYTDNDGELGEIIGQTAVTEGINRNISVTLTADPTETLYAVLHLDGGELGVFEPDEDDIPLQRNRAIISAPFTIIE